MNKTTNKYSMGYNEKFVDMLKQRTAETYAKFLLPYLKPNFKVLDCGCGPGSMTIGFAKYVPQGDVIGIDIEEGQLAIAYEEAEKAKICNISFERANVLKLPFADNTFDVVFSQGLLSHLNDPIAAILEQKRVTKPGGIVAAKNGYFEGTAFYPPNKLAKEVLQFTYQPISENGGDPNIGIKLGALFRAAKLRDVKQTMYCESIGTKKMALIFADEIINRDYSKRLLSEGKVVLTTLQQYQKFWLDFAADPDAFSYMPFGEVVGFK